MIALEHISKRFGGVVALSNVSQTFRTGKSYALAGPNGCGKTTLLNVVSGFYGPDRGAVYLHRNGRKTLLNRLSAARRARLGVGRTFQEPRQFAEFTVEENLLVCLLAPGSDSLVRRGLRKFSTLGHGERIDHLLLLGGLQDARDKPTKSLSYGQRKVLDFLCLLSREPKAIFLDEPFAGVDPKNLETMLELLTAPRRKEHTTTVIVSHEMALVRQAVDRVLLMDQGRIVASGHADEILTSPQFEEACLG